MLVGDNMVGTGDSFDMIGDMGVLGGRCVVNKLDTDVTLRRMEMGLGLGVLVLGFFGDADGSRGGGGS